MSLIAKGRVLATKALDKHGIPAVVTRKAGATRTLADRAAGNKAGTSSITLEGKGLIGKRTIKLADGTRTVEATITTQIPLKANDTIEIGALTFTVTIVEEVNPGAEVTAIIYVAGLK